MDFVLSLLQDFEFLTRQMLCIFIILLIFNLLSNLCLEPQSTVLPDILNWANIFLVFAKSFSLFLKYKINTFISFLNACYNPST